MIEAVNSVVSNASALRAGTQQVDASVAATVNVTPVAVSDYEAPEAPKAPYISPYIALDFNYDKAVLQIRDSETGDVQDQFPSESRLAEIRRAQAQVEQARISRGGNTQQRQEVSETRSDTPSPEVREVRSQSVVSVQDAVSTPAANTVSAPNAQAASAALSAAAQSGQASTISVSVQA